MNESLFLRALFDGMRCGILCADRDGRLLVINDLAVQVLGLAESPESGLPLEIALADHPRLVRMLVDSFAMPQLPNREELILGDEENPGRTIGYTLSNVSHDGDHPIGVAMFFKDLTLIEQKEERARLKDRLAALGEMAASLAHEIRNPLASIKVTCSLLRRRLDDDAARNLLDKITAEVNRLNGTICSSLEFVRPVELSLAASDVTTLLEQAIEVATSRADGVPIAVRTNHEAALPEVQIDRDQVRQVFENLLLNAVEAAGEGGSVKVDTRVVEGPANPTIGCELPQEPQQLIEIRVADSGPGISEDDSEKVFYPFFTTKEKGSGIGLSMAKKIVDCHHGLIEVENGQDGGAVFIVRLPVNQA